VEIQVLPRDGRHLEARELEDTRSVRSVLGQADHLVLTVAEPHLAIPALLDKLQAGGWELASLTTRHASLEDVFVALTGRHLRDDGE
jgi:ABC-2 type transport system ATP-binding protein